MKAIQNTPNVPIALSRVTPHVPSGEDQRLLQRRLKRIQNLKAKNALLSEQLMAQQQMMEQTTRYLVSLQQELTVKNNDLAESIAYARYIQNAILPLDGLLQIRLPESFVYYRPHGVVSGDLPWVKTNDTYTLIAAIDCSGHGVPGAMLTMLAYALLNDVSRQTGLADPAALLTQLDAEWTHSIQKTVANTQIAESLDAAVVSYNHESGELRYTGARRPLLLWHSGELIEVNGDDISVSADDQAAVFSATVFQLKPGDRVYLFTDGITDQFGGGENTKKFGKKRLRELIEAASDLAMPDQHARLSSALSEWQGTQPQTDDMLLMAFQA